jgi:hypothetical protein
MHVCLDWSYTHSSIKISAILHNDTNLFLFYCSHSTEHTKLHHLPLFTLALSSIRTVCHTLSTMEWRISRLHLLSTPLLVPSPQQVTLLACTRVSVTVPCSDWYCCSYGVDAHGNPCTASICDLLWIPIWYLIIPDLCTRSLWQLQAETSSSEAGETCRKWSQNFAYKEWVWTC